MSEFVQQKTRTSTRDRSCIWCPEPIRKGELYEAVTWRDGGQLATEGFHPECAAAWDSADNDWNDSGWSPGCFKRGTLEEI